MSKSKLDEKEIIYLNCTDLYNQLRVDGIYYYNFQAYIYLVWIMAFMIVFINGFCLIVMTKTKALSNPSDILLKCMVISDLLMGALPVPFWLVSWFTSISLLSKLSIIQNSYLIWLLCGLGKLSINQFDYPGSIHINMSTISLCKMVRKSAYI